MASRPTPAASLQPAGRGTQRHGGILLGRPWHRPEEGLSSSGPAAPLLLASRRASLRPSAYLQAGSEPQSSVASPCLDPNSIRSASANPVLILPSNAGAATSPLPPPPAPLAVVQEQGGASLLQLVAAWDQLAARLPPQTGAGRGAELILEALKVAVAYAPAAPVAAPTFAAAAAAPSSEAEAAAAQQPVALPLQQQQQQLARPVARAVSLASRLADLAASGLPIDAESIAAGILAEVLLAGAHAPGAWTPTAPPTGAATGLRGTGGSSGGLSLQIIEERVGPIVAQLVHDIQRARQLPARVELLDDTAASALRELCLSFYDVRATAVEIVARLDLLCSPAGQPSYEQQVAALEALQMYAPMGHALGLGQVAQQLEDRCFQILFPESYVRTAAWLREEAAANADTLERCKAALTAAVLRHPRFAELASGLVVRGRTKTLFSTLKKLLRLGNTAAGGRARTQLYDLMGLRAIVQPRTDLPQAEAEVLAAQACYLVRDAACSLWDCVPERAKDYIAVPKPNGYQSLHSTVRVAGPTAQAAGLSLGSAGRGLAAGDGASAEGVRSTATLELQIRTQAMHECAERGEASHGAYKGGLDAAQALQLKAVTEAVLQRAAAAAAAAAAAPAAAVAPGAASVAATGSGSSSTDAAADWLFRHLDQNGDGRISLEELQFALQELGVHEEQAQSRAAAELLQLASADDCGEGGEGAGQGDGTIGFEAFMAFQRRVGLLQALSAVDHQQAHLLEEQHAVAVEGALPDLSSSSSSMDDSSLFCDPLAAASLPWTSGSFDGGDSAGGGSSRLAASAMACRAHGRARQQGSSSSALGGGMLCWHPPAGQPGSGRWGSRQRSTLVVRAAIETASNCSSSDSAESDVDVQEAAASSSSSSNAVHGTASAASSVVALEGQQQASGSHGSNGSHASSNGNGNGNGDRAAGHNGAASTVASSSPAPPTAAATPSASPAGPQAMSHNPELRPPPSRQANARAGTGAASQREAAAAWQATRAVQGIVRLISQEGPPPADATWQLVPAPGNPYCLLNAAGEPLPATAAVFGGEPRVQALRVPEQGPCIIGAVLNRDCDCVLDVPTVSGRHVRIEAQRRPDAKGGYSRLLLTDLGSTNGTHVNRRRVEPFKEVPLRPGDIVWLAERDVVFEVQVVPPAPPAPAMAASNVMLATAAAASSAEAVLASDAAAEAQQAAAVLPAVVTALRIVGALETLAAAQGLFPPGGAVYADLPDRARQLMTAGSYDQAYVLLLAGVMQQPWSGGLWAQLANLERQRARRCEASGSGNPNSAAGGSYAAARAFFAAAVACFAAITPAWAGGELRASAERAEGLTRVYASWAQMEQQMGNTGAARTLFRRGAAAAREHPTGAAAAGAPRLLVTWARQEWKAGDAVEAQRLCLEAIEADSGNAYALTLLGTIKVAVGQLDIARLMFGRALESDPAHTAALQAWGRLEATTGSMRRARDLFRRALALEPNSTFVLQAWGVAEARRGSKQQARRLLQRATDTDPGCRAAWHAWGKLEDEVGSTNAARELYLRALSLGPGSVVTLNALGRLERRAGDLAAAERHLAAALEADPAHMPSLAELALLRQAQGRPGEAAVLKRRASRLAISHAQDMQEVAAAAGEALPPPRRR